MKLRLCFKAGIFLVYIDRCPDLCNLLDRALRSFNLYDIRRRTRSTYRISVFCTSSCDHLDWKLLCHLLFQIEFHRIIHAGNIDLTLNRVAFCLHRYRYGIGNRHRGQIRNCRKIIFIKCTDHRSSALDYDIHSISTHDIVHLIQFIKHIAIDLSDRNIGYLPCRLVVGNICHRKPGNNREQNCRNLVSDMSKLFLIFSHSFCPLSAVSHVCAPE